MDQIWPNIPPAGAIEEIIRIEREDRLKKQVDTYGLALMMIIAGAVDPKKIAQEALDKVK